jgi:hypothetical protein
VLAGEHAGEFHAVDLLHQARQQFAHLVEGRLVLALPAEFAQHLQVVQLALGGRPVVDQLGQGGPLSQNLLGPFVVIPEIRSGDCGFQFGNPLTLAVEVKDTSSARRACS